MGKTAEELRFEIAQQRVDLTRDFEMIGDRVSPSRMVERRTAAQRMKTGIPVGPNLLAKVKEVALASGAEWIMDR